MVATVAAGMDSQGNGMMINSSRAILYASRGDDWRDAAQAAAIATRNAINDARNKQRYGDLHKWLAKGVQDGLILALPKETYASLLIGPAENFCRAWLSGRVKESPIAYAEVFAEAAWRAVGR